MEYKDKVVIVTGGAQAAMTIDTTNLCSHLQKKLFEPEGVYYPIWQAMQNDEELTAVVRSRQLHIYRNGKKILILAGKAQPKIIREDKLNEWIIIKIKNEGFRKHLGRQFHRQSCIRKSHGEMQFCRYRYVE